jgi:hypothetical protein
MTRNRELADRDVDLARQTYGYSVEGARNVLARRLGQTNWFKGLGSNDGARAAFQELAEARAESTLKALWWAMCHFAAEDGVELTLVCRLGNPAILREQRRAEIEIESPTARG